MNLTFRVAEIAARLRRRSASREIGHSRQGYPPRVPHQRRRRLQCFQGQRSQDRIQSLGFFRKIWRSSKPRARERPSVSQRRRRGKNRPASLELSAAIPASQDHPFDLGRPAQFHGQRPDPSEPASAIRKFEIGLRPASPSRSCSTSRLPAWGDLFYRDYNSFNYIGNERNQTYGQTSLGGVVRLGFPVTEFVSFGTRYSLIRDNITLDKDTFYTDPNEEDPLVPTVCDPLKAGRYLCQEVGKSLTSAIGLTTAYEHPTAFGRRAATHRP